MSKELTDLFKPYPQKNISVPIKNKNPLNDPVVKKVIKEQELSIANNGRIIVRESGTEPIIRVMVESKDKVVINDICKIIVSTIEKSVNTNN